jgi:hypothetical protein
MVGIMSLCHVLQALLEFLLIFHIDHTLVLVLALQSFQLLLNLSILTSLPLTTELLFSKLLTPLVLNTTKVRANLLCDC